jgi:hypothetical protein
MMVWSTPSLGLFVFGKGKLFDNLISNVIAWLFEQSDGYP